MDLFKQTYINTINTCINVSGELILKMKIFKHPPFFKFFPLRGFGTSFGKKMALYIRML